MKMKKRMAAFLVMVQLLTLSACGNVQTLETTAQTISDTTENLQTTTAYTTQNTTQITTDREPVAETQDPFESFMTVENYDPFANKLLTLIPERRFTILPSIVFFEVLGVERIEWTHTIYRVRFTDAYGYDPFDHDAVYLMGRRGTPTEQLYGRPPLEIGKTYAHIEDYLPQPIPSTRMLTSDMVYGVREADGKRWLYGYGVDFSQMACSVEITDPVENCPYEKGKHDKAISYLQEIGQPLPTFDNKCEVEALWSEILKRMIRTDVS